MRLWSIHPKYLDQKGLVACWRESLGALAALEGRVQGYKNHPQLNRFKLTSKPVVQMHAYLYYLLQESLKRGYKFDSSKINIILFLQAGQMTVAGGQLAFEREHLLGKLKERDNNKYKRLIKIPHFDPHPIFKRVPGSVEEWEKL